MEPQKDLDYLLSQIIEGIHDVIRCGYHEKGFDIPVLDPLSQLPNIREHLDIGSAHVDISINDPVLKGLSSIQIREKPKLNVANRTVSIGISFDQLSFVSQDFKAEGSYRVLFKHRLNKEGFIHIDAKDVNVVMKFALRLNTEGPTIKANGSEIRIEHLNVDIEDSIVLDVLIPLFKKHIGHALSLKLENTLEQVLTAKLRQLYTAQKPIFDKLVQLYRMKKADSVSTDADGNPEKPRLMQGFGGVGELPLPIFWELPSVDVDNLEHIGLEELKRQATTGDVILFSGALASSQKIRRYTQSAFSHVVMVVKEPELADGQALVWQSTSSTHRGVLRNMELRSGIQLNHLDEMIRDYLLECPGSIVVYRSLKRQQRDSKVERERWQAVLDFINREDGKPYTDDMEGLYIMGLMEVENPKSDDFFCAGLVAHSLMDYGILKDTFRQYQYAPRDFSALQQTLPYSTVGIAFGPEVVVDV